MSNTALHIPTEIEDSVLRTLTEAGYTIKWTGPRTESTEYIITSHPETPTTH